MMFDAVRKIEGDFHIVTTWQALAAGESSKEARRRMGHFGRRIREGRQDKEVKGDEAIKNAENIQVVDDLKDLQKRLAQGAYLGWFSLAAAAYGEDENAVKETVAELQKVFLSHQAELIVHKENQLSLLVSTLPGGYSQPCHRFLVENRDYANLAMWAKSSEGRPRNEHLDCGPLLVMRTTAGTAYNFHLHGPRELGLEDLANTVGIGRPGSGKTVLQNFVIAAVQRCVPKPRTLILDIDNSFEGITQAFGGKYVRIEPGSETFRVNPFAQEKTLEHKDFLLRFLKCLIEFGSRPVTRAEELMLADGINLVYALPRELRTLGQFAKGLPSSLEMGLAKWVGSGHYAHYFDNVEDEFTLAEFQTINFAKDLAKEVMVACPMWILHQEDRVIQDESLGDVLKLVAIDEAKALFEYKVLMEYALHVERRGRKKNAPLFLMSQLVDDFEGEAAGVRKMSATQIYLSQPSADGDYREGFGLKPEEIQVIRSLPRGMIYMKQGPGRGKILDVCLDPAAAALCRSDNEWKTRRRDLFDRFGAVEGLRKMVEGGME
jgi:type IV secretion system protein VirB4